MLLQTIIELASERVNVEHHMGHRKTPAAALAISACCVGHFNVPRWPTQRAAFARFICRVEKLILESLAERNKMCNFVAVITRLTQIMRKSVFAAVVLIAGLQTTWAQKMTVRMNNDKTYVYKVPQVAEVTFSEDLVNKEYVNLGLPSGTLWATCNVGADRPEEFGDYFAWGEVLPKERYDWFTYMFCNDTENSMTKYCTSSEYGAVDGVTELKRTDDAATATWGDEWETPSLEQWSELLYGGYPDYYTSKELITVNDVLGLKVTSNINGNSIFLPAAGVFNGTSASSANTQGYYWSRTLNGEKSSTAYYTFFYSGSSTPSMNNIVRFAGLSVRPVRATEREPQLVTDIILSASFLNLMLGETATLTASVLPADAANRAVVWQNSNSSVAELDASGRVIAKGRGSCVITCRAMDGSNVYAECHVNVGSIPRGSISGREWVDLKLPSQTLWATCNVGAYNPEEYGYYFAWGETTTKDEYTWHNYHYSDDSSSTQMTKYVTSSSYGTVDDLKQLEHDDDAASVLCGIKWQMPTEDQWRELTKGDYTTYKWITVNGYEGIMFTSKINGESVFFPAAGYRSEEKTNDMGKVCNYWTRTLNKSNNSQATRFYKNSGTMAPQMSNGYGRNIGLPVRPVLAQGMLVPTQLVTNIILNPQSISLNVNEAETITAFVIPTNADITEVVWESSNEDVADVTQNGRVVGCAEGSCVITCRATDGSDVFAECQVTVGSETIHPIRKQ